MRRITAAALLASALVVAPAAASQAAVAADVGQAATVRTSSAEAGELWEYHSTHESLGTCSFVGEWGVITDAWLAYFCEWDDYRDGYSLWIRVF